jgi:hypothetical protein
MKKEMERWDVAGEAGLEEVGIISGICKGPRVRPVRALHAGAEASGALGILEKLGSQMLHDFTPRLLGADVNAFFDL